MRQHNASEGDRRRFSLTVGSLALLPIVASWSCGAGARAPAATTSASDSTTGRTSARSAAPSRQDRAISTLALELRRRGDELRCRSFGVEETTGRHVEIAVREDHSPPCAGDPAVAPIVGRYRVLDSGTIETFDPVEGEWKD